MTARNDRYKWTALSNTTLGVFMATLDSSIVIISLPAIFRGIHLDPLHPSNIGYLLWMLMGYLVVTAVLVVNWETLTGTRGTASPWAWALPTLIGSPIIAWISREVALGRRPKF